jgi:long-chain fatty acid transport protein
MMRRFLKLSAVVSVVVLSFTPAWGGGVILYEVSTTEIAHASAGYAARAGDPSTVFTNPAGMILLDGTQIMAGVHALYGDVKFEPDQNTSPFLGSNGGGNAIGWLPGGNAYLSHRSSDNVSLGLGLLSNFGLGMDYEDDWVGRYYVRDIALIGLSVVPSVAFRLSDSFSVGVGVDFMYGILDQTMAVNNGILQPDGALEISSNDWGVGANLGLMMELSEGSRLGLTYHSPMDLNFSDTPETTDVRPLLDTIIQGLGQLDMGMTVPQTVMVSVYHETSERAALMGNVGWQDWSQFGMVDVTVSTDPPTDLTVDRRYQDTWHVAFGGELQASENWRLSGGLAYDSSIVKDEDRTVDLPLGDGYRLGIGSRYRPRANFDLNLGYEFLWGGDLSVDQERGPLAGRVSGEYKDTAMHFLSVGAVWRF